MKSFRHLTAETIEACIALLDRYGGRARLIAGGTDLLGILKDRIIPEYPDVIIDIKNIPDLDTVRETSGKLRIGALAKIAAVAESPIVRRNYSALAKAAQSVATPVVRTMATVGGNLCQSVRCWYYRYPHELGGLIPCRRKGSDQCPAITGDNRYHAILGMEKCAAVCPSDTAVALAALNAKVRILGLKGERWISVADFFTPLGTVLRSNEVLVEIQVPAPPPAAGQSFIKLCLRKPVDFAIVSAASVLSVRNSIVADARICLGAVAFMPVRATAAEQLLMGKPLSAARLHSAAEAALADAKPLPRNAYKVELAKAAVRKSLKDSSREV